MARQYGVNATKRYATIPQLAEQGQAGGRVKSLYDTFTITAALTDEFIEMGELPAGARVIDVRFVFADMDASGGTIDVGWEASSDAVEAVDLDGFGANVDVTSAGVYSTFTTGSALAGYQKVFAAPVKVGLTVDGDCDATSGVIHMEVLYAID